MSASLTDSVLKEVWRVADGASGEVRTMARFCLLDWFGVALAGCHEPLVEILVDDARVTGGNGKSTLVGRPERFSLRDSVLINGAAGHAIDYDDGHGAMMGHPSVAILPAVLGLAAARGKSGDAVVAAVVAAVEAAGRIGQLVYPNHYERGFHATGTVGALAAAAGCAHLLGLDARRAAVALGLAGTRSAGLKASFGTDGKPLHAGWASFVGLTAALWAERGMTGQADILGHKQGFGQAFSTTFDPEAAMAAAPRGAHILRVSFKRHAACGVTHPTIDAASQLRREADLTPEKIAKAVIRIDRRANDICNIQTPVSGLQAKFSLRTVAAMAFCGIDTASPASFTDEAATAPALARLRDRIEVDLQPDWTVGDSEVIVETVEGKRHELASPLRDLDKDPADLAPQLAAKFSALASLVLGEAGAARLGAMIGEVEGLGDAGALLDAARAADPQPRAAVPA